MDNLILSQISTSAIVVFIIQFVKQSKWFPWITAETEKLNRFVSIIASGLAAVGIHATYSHGTLMITNLTVTAILTGSIEWFRSFVFQHLIYKIAFPKLLATVQQPPSQKP